MRRIACALALLMTATPASAEALTITASTDENRRTTVNVAGTAADEQVSIGGDGFVTISANPPVTFAVGGECVEETPQRVTCNGAMHRLTGDLGGGDDRATVFLGAGEGASVALSLGEGDDFLQVNAHSGTGVPWSFDAGPGADELSTSSTHVDPVTISGGEGNDLIEGTANDHLDAGAGDDVLRIDDPHDFELDAGSAAGGPGRDIFVGGENNEAAGFVLNGGVVSSGPGDPGTTLPQTTTGFEGLAVRQGVAPVRLEGDDGPNELYACGGATLIGNGGDDVIDANANGHDPLDACHSTDAPSSYSGGPGADTIRSNNLVAETVDCGEGVDTQVLADPSDTLVDCEATGVSFTEAPEGFVASGAATFAWEAPSAPPGSTFECSLDDAAFTACTSSRSLTGLGEGEHSFRVRVVSSGTPGPPTERRWTVDTVVPFVQLTQVPPGDGAPTDVDLAWQASEPGTFVCSEDGRPQAPCSSPARLVGLAPGRHTFSVVAVDRAGNVSATAAAASWAVGSAPAEQPPAPVSCPQGTQATVTLGVIVARALSEDACFRPAPEISATALRARGPVLVNGMRITPRTGAFTIDRNLGGGEIGTTGPWTLGLGRVSLDINTPLGLGGMASAFQQAVQRNVQILTRDAPKAFGMRLRGAIGLEFSTDNGGQSKATLNVELPNLFRGVPDGGGPPAGSGTGARGVTFEVSATASNDRGVFFSGRGRLNTLWLAGKIKLKNLEIAVDQGAGTFSGSVGISLKDSLGGPPIPNLGGEATLTATLEFGPNGLFGSELRKLSVQASELSIRVHPIVFLQRVGAELSASVVDGRQFAVLAGSAGISFGPKLEIPPLFDGEVASIDGTLRLIVPMSPPIGFSLEVEGIGKLVEFQVAQARVRYTTPARVEMEGRLDLTVGGYGSFSQIRTSWFDGSTSQFNVEAFGALRVPGLGLGEGLDLESEAVLSSRGFAVCAGDQDGRFGFGRLWGGQLRTFLNTCDLGGFRVVAARAAGGGARTFAVRRGTRVLSVAVRGGKAELTGPRGARLATPAGPEPVLTAAGLVVQDPEQATTWFVLRRPAAGTWSVTGSTVTGVRVADPLPPVRLRVKVAGKGTRRKLTWRGVPAGHRLVLNELGRGSSRVLLTTGRSRGRKAFRPAAGPGRARRLVATVTRGGLPRFEGTVARYVAARPPKLRAVKRLRRGGRVIRWRGQAAASSYAISLRLPDGSTIVRTVRKPRTTLPKAARRGAVAVAVLAIAADGRTGPAVSKRLKA